MVSNFGILLIGLLYPSLTLASPIERGWGWGGSSDHYELQPLFGGSALKDGSSIPLSKVGQLSGYQLTGGNPSWGETFSTIVVGSTDGSDSDTLIAGYGGQSAIGLGGHYLLGLPRTTYAHLSIKDLFHLTGSIEVCIYIYSDPAKPGHPSVDRNNFDLDQFVSAVGLTGPVAQLCVDINTDGRPSTTSAAPSSTSAPSSSSSASMSSSTSSESSSSTSSSVPSSTPSGTIPRNRTEPNPDYAVSVPFNGQTYINKGLVAFGAISGDAQDSTGLSLSLGSAIALKSIHKRDDGIFEGEMWCLPDRGHNTQETVNYQARRHLVSFTLNPYYDEAKLEYQQAKQTFDLKYQYSQLFSALGQATTGVDPLTYTNDTGDIHYPIPASDNVKLSVDSEGMVANDDGSVWISDEYGPYIYKFDASGNLQEAIAPPKAILPELNGDLYFSANSKDVPTTGRIQNSGFEGLTLSPDGETLYALLQQGTTQDEEDNDEDHSRYSRLVAYDITGKPTLVHAWVLELPVTNGKSKTLKQSDFHCLSDGVFVVLSRDGKGNGNDDSESKHKDFILYSTDGATDIVGTEYTDDVTPVAPGDQLVDGVTAMTGTQLIDIIDETQLERFGLHNDGDFDVSLIDGKWESIAVASCEDPENPDDYYLFSFADNDFIALNGVDPSGPYSDPYAEEKGYSLDNQALVWRVTIPNYGN